MVGLDPAIHASSVTHRKITLLLINYFATEAAVTAASEQK
jgi:hypothetical protein